MRDAYKRALREAAMQKTTLMHIYGILRIVAIEYPLLAGVLSSLRFSLFA